METGIPHLFSRRITETTVRLFIAFAVLGLILMLPIPSGLSIQGHRVLAVVAMSVVLWTSEATLLPVNALIIIVMLVLTGGVPSLATALYGFSQPVTYFLIGILVMGAAVSRSGLAERIALYFVLRSRGSPLRLFTHSVLSLPILALVLPSAITRNGILIPVYKQIFKTLKLDRNDTLTRSIMLTLGILNPLASSALLTGGIAPVITASLLGGFTWLRWFAMMGVPYYTLLVCGATLVYVLPGLPKRELSILGTGNGRRRKFAASEIRVMVIVGVTSALWLTDFIHHWHPAIPALLAAVVLLLPGIGVMTWKEFEREAAWSNFFILATALSLAQAVLTSGTAAWCAQRLVQIFSWLAYDSFTIIVLIILTIALAHVGIPNIAASISLMIPVMLILGPRVGINPIVCGLLVCIGVDAIVLYPTQTSTNILAYQTGYYSARDVLKVGIGMSLLTIAVVVLIVLPYWHWIGLKFKI